MFKVIIKFKSIAEIIEPDRNIPESVMNVNGVEQLVGAHIVKGKVYPAIINKARIFKIDNNDEFIKLTRQIEPLKAEIYSEKTVRVSIKGANESHYFDIPPDKIGEIIKILESKGKEIDENENLVEGKCPESEVDIEKKSPGRPKKE